MIRSGLKRIPYALIDKSKLTPFDPKMHANGKNIIKSSKKKPHIQYIPNHKKMNIPRAEDFVFDYDLQACDYLIINDKIEGILKNKNK
tara:strand:- start:462 stop:725 length:264 start_codon:yes stop_codon:yes gene_type:complete